MNDETNETWWDAFSNAGGLPNLETWLGGVDADSRHRLRQRIAECGYKTVLDCGAGLGLDWIGFQNISYPVEYTGLEASQHMIDAAEKNARSYRQPPPPITRGSIEEIPFGDSSFDMVYCRHVFEHLPRFEVALSEMIRAAILEVVVVFFMPPGPEAYLFRERDGLWQNRYAKNDVDQALAGNSKVEVWFYETLHTEVLLHVYLHDSLKVDAGRVAERVSERSS